MKKVFGFGIQIPLNKRMNGDYETVVENLEKKYTKALKKVGFVGKVEEGGGGTMIGSGKYDVDLYTKASGTKEFIEKQEKLFYKGLKRLKGITFFEKDEV